MNCEAVRLVYLMLWKEGFQDVNKETALSWDSIGSTMFVQEEEIYASGL